MSAKPLSLAIKTALYLGGFSTMALSNAVVPVLTDMTSEPALVGAVYSAYFLGAFLTVFAAGWFSDKIGKEPLIKLGLIGTFVSAILLWAVYPDVYLTIALRFIEGLFTGIFISVSTSYVNSLNKPKILGIYVAYINLGLAGGFFVSGLAATISPNLGILLLGLLVALSMAGALSGMRSSQKEIEQKKAKLASLPEILTLSKYYLFVWLAICIGNGVTGVIISMYPDMTQFSPEITGTVTAVMSVASAVAVYIAPKFKNFSSLSAVRIYTVILAITVPFTYITTVPAVTSLAMIAAGFFYGFIYVALLNYIAQSGKPQGVMNGLYFTGQYAGMSLLPFILGFTISGMGYLGALAITAALCLVCGLLVARRGLNTRKTVD